LYTELFTIIAPILVCATIGFAWEKSGRPFDSRMLTRLVVNFGTPCLVFSSLTRLEADRSALWAVGLAMAAVLACAALLALGVVLVARRSPRDYLPAMTFGNSGNMGLPLCLFAFGEAGLTLGVACFAVTALAQFTFGGLMASGEPVVRHVTRAPIVWAVAAALAVMATGAPVPRWIGNTIELLSGMVIPLMLIMLGVSLARLKIRSFARTLPFSLVRLAGGFAIGLAVAELAGLEGIARGVLILQASMPVAVFNYLFAEQYDREAGDVAAMVVLSTLISFATLPVLLWFVLGG